ncbi:MAG: hypothetical protein H6509_12140 [Bryobacterales bacterium]|nr:hypothetical protein [Bryobacterales bacterium]
MTVIETKMGTNIPDAAHRGLVERVIRKVLPLANPEVDDEGTPQRELGFDTDEQPIVAGPIGENFGFWTDSSMKFRPAEHRVVSSKEFAATWAQFVEPLR